MVTLEDNAPQDVIDAAHHLASKLIQTGKTWTDSKSIRLNFVFSEGSLHNFVALSGGGAAKRTLIAEIKELNSSKAIAFMKGYHKYVYGTELDDTDAVKMYQECGGLFTDMTDMVNKKDVDWFKRSKSGEFGSQFIELGILIRPELEVLTSARRKAWKILETVAKDGEISYPAAENIADGDSTLLDKLCSKGGPLFLLIHETHPKFEFVSTPLKRYVEQTLVECETLFKK